MTTEEELRALDDNIRRLKIEYDAFFNGGSKKPPTDLEWRVKSVLAKYSDGGSMNFAQRFHYNSLAQKYAVFADLWRKKMRIREEGYRRPQDALLAVQGVRLEPEAAAERRLAFLFDPSSSDRHRETQDIASLYHAVNRERRRASLPETGSVESFERFIRAKTQQVRKEFGCQLVEYSVETNNGTVRLKARPK